jgi:hypothetical protein
MQLEFHQVDAFSDQPFVATRRWSIGWTPGSPMS